MICREEIDKCICLEDAIKSIFNVNISGRTSVLNYEEMTGELAKAYSQLTRNHRQEAYRRIAEDFITRTRINKGIILDVGCGDGILTQKISGLCDSLLVGIDSSKELFPDSTNKELFVHSSVYNLTNLFGEGTFDYVFCRNTLHRFKQPKRAIEQMLRVTRKGVYIRDLKRNAPWEIVLQRIGDERWKSPILVKDYIGAMAAMFTEEELMTLLTEFNLDYNFSKGDYTLNRDYRGMPEFENIMDFVCLIRK